MRPSGNISGRMGRVQTGIYFDTFNSLAAAVRGRRGELRLSQTELAHRSQVSRKFIGALESGQGTRNVTNTLKVLRHLGIEPYALPALPPAQPTITPAAYDAQFRRTLRP